MAETRRFRQVLAVMAVIGTGLALRRYGYDLGLPFVAVKYGGSILWGAMVFLLLALLTGATRVSRMVVGAVIVAAAVEFSRLYHTPELDAFRLTTAGKLLLGRVFSFWNLVAYATGIGLAAALEWRLVTRERGSAA